MAAHLTATHTTKVELYGCKSIEPRGSSNRQPPTGEQMKIYTLLVVLLLIFVGCKHFESRHSTFTGTGAVCKPQCSEEQINELAEPIF